MLAHPKTSYGFVSLKSYKCTKEKEKTHSFGDVTNSTPTAHLFLSPPLTPLFVLDPTSVFLTLDRPRMEITFLARSIFCALVYVEGNRIIAEKITKFINQNQCHGKRE